MEKPTSLLIIDDDMKMGRLLAQYLEPQGYVVDLVHNGKDGLRRALEGAYQAIILDVMLPEMNGYEVLRELRKHSSVPVLMLTALGDEPDRIQGLEVGADDYLPKTFSTTELSARLRAVLRRAAFTGSDYEELKQDREDLDQARDIQQALLPNDLPRFEGYQISGKWIPAKSVGGDYYDVLALNQNRIAICIGDVSGKGMPAALLMANLQAAVKAFSSELTSPAELCRKVNAILCGNIAGSKYITFFYGIVDPGANRLVYTCAGHNPPLLLRRDGSEMRLDRGGTVLGLFSETQYEEASVELTGDDRLLLFTDGITEAIGANGEEFGEERLFRILRDRPDLSATDLRDAVIEEVSNFSVGNFHDDVTLVIVKVNS